MKVRAVFAYYNPPYEDLEAGASYLIIESDQAELPKHGNVCAEQLMEAGVGIPLTPTYRTWVNLGKPTYNGGDSKVNNATKVF